MKGKYLITTDAWFIAPDGHSYKAAWGEVEIVEGEEKLKALQSIVSHYDFPEYPVKDCQGFPAVRA